MPEKTCAHIVNDYYDGSRQCRRKAIRDGLCTLHYKFSPQAIKEQAEISEKHRQQHAIDYASSIEAELVGRWLRLTNPSAYESIRSEIADDANVASASGENRRVMRMKRIEIRWIGDSH